MELLEGTEERWTMEEKEEEKYKKKGRNECYEEEEEEIIKEEIIEQLRKLKKEKAPGENGIEDEAWRLMPNEVGKVLFKLINKIWKEREIPDWIKGIISLLYKKGDKKETKNYRGITLVDTAYKIYASILNER